MSSSGVVARASQLCAFQRHDAEELSRAEREVATMRSEAEAKSDEDHTFSPTRVCEAGPLYDIVSATAVPPAASSPFLPPLPLSSLFSWCLSRSVSLSSLFFGLPPLRLLLAFSLLFRPTLHACRGARCVDIGHCHLVRTNMKLDLRQGTRRLRTCFCVRSLHARSAGTCTSFERPSGDRVWLILFVCGTGERGSTREERLEHVTDGGGTHSYLRRAGHGGAWARHLRGSTPYLLAHRKKHRPDDSAFRNKHCSDKQPES